MKSVNTEIALQFSAEVRHRSNKLDSTRSESFVSLVVGVFVGIVRSCLFVCNVRAGVVCGWVCYHDNAKLLALIFSLLGEGSDHLQLIKFWPSCASGKGSAAGRTFLAPRYYAQRACSVCVSPSAFFTDFLFSARDVDRDLSLS